MTPVAATKLERLNSKRIPVLPPGASHLIHCMADDSIQFRQLAQIVEGYPSIAARLIALANSAWSAPVSPVASIESACARLGFNVVRSTSIALAVAAPFNPMRCPSFKPQLLWSRALLVADVSCTLAESTPGDFDRGSLSTAGLLHNLGLLWLADQLPFEMHQAFRKRQSEPEASLRTIMQEMIGIDYCDAGYHIGTCWDFPQSLVTSMGWHADPALVKREWPIAALVGIGVEVAALVERQLDDISLDLTQELSALQEPELGIDMAGVMRAMDFAKAQLPRIRELAAALFE